MVRLMQPWIKPVQPRFFLAPHGGAGLSLCLPWKAIPL